jgi:type IV pilus assembly protein PilO
MATQTKTSTFDVSLMLDQAAGQFRGLNSREPGQWPILPKVATWLLLAVMAIVLGWFLLISDKDNELDAERNKEPGLRKEYRDKLAQAVNLPELRKQKQQVEEYVTQLEKQLPGKAEMDALLTDINQAGIGRGLQFELFRPGAVAVRDYYAELPISIRVVGRYHDIGAFTADIANLSRIVTLHEVTLSGGGAAGLLGMDATARTYRYLDAAEVAGQKKPAAGAK